MKKIALLIAVLIVFTSVSAFAEGSGNPMTKLGRGLLDVATAVFELPKAIGEVSSEEGAVVGATKGLFDGIAKLVLRGVTGIYEVVTFPIAVPAGYEPVLDSTVFGE